MNKKERILRILLIILAFLVCAISVVYVNVTGNFLSDIGSKLVVSISNILLIIALLIGINRNPKSKSAKIGAISGLTVLLILRWI